VHSRKCYNLGLGAEEVYRLTTAKNITNGIIRYIKMIDCENKKYILTQRIIALVIILLIIGGIIIVYFICLNSLEFAFE